jgi:signal transduction histidine kinase
VLWARLNRIPDRWMDRGIVLLLQPVYLGWAARHHAAVAVPLGLATTLPLLYRRRFPLPVLGATVVGTVVLELAYGWAAPIAVWFGVFTVAIRLPRRVSLSAAVVTGAALLASAATTDSPSSVLPHLISVAAAWLIGDTIKERRAFIDEERQEHGRRAVAEEQSRIARELHDVIAHNVSVMVIQAAAADDVFDASPERAREALRSIERTGREALTELRRLLGTVRVPEQDVYTPQPGLHSLGELLARIRSAGLPVTVHIEGSLADLPAGLDLSAYRIVQEALTNTLKHADASRAEVGLRRTETALELEIVDDGAGGGNGAGGGAGQGLIGMRERAALVGGELEAGPQPGGGFRVRARLPL